MHKVDAIYNNNRTQSNNRSSNKSENRNQNQNEKENNLYNENPVGGKWDFFGIFWGLAVEIVENAFAEGDRRREVGRLGKKPPLCKGRWLPEGQTEGLLGAETNSREIFVICKWLLDNPPVKNQRFLTAPFTQGGLWRMEVDGGAFGGWNSGEI